MFSEGRAAELPEKETMVKKYLDQKTRARNFEARNERTVTRNTGEKVEAMGSPSALSKNREMAINGKLKGKCTRRDACSFRHDYSERRASARSSSPTPKSQTNKMVNNLRKAAAQEKQSIRLTAPEAVRR